MCETPQLGYFGLEIVTPEETVTGTRVPTPSVIQDVLAIQRGIEVIERHIKPEELKQVSEIFLTGTAAEVTPVGKIGEQNFAVGNITKQLMSDYTALVNQ